MSNDTPEFWAQAGQQFQQSLTEGWGKAIQSLQNLDLGALGAQAPQAPAAQAPVKFSPDKLQELQQQYLQDAAKLWTEGMQGAPKAKDKRFSADAWAANPMAAFSAAAYLLNSRTLMGMADAVEGDEKTRARIRFAVEQLNAASAPSNF